MMCHESETARLVPSQFGRESQDSCDFEARQLKLRSDKPCDHQSPRFDCCQESQEGLAGLADCCNVWHHCLLRCLGPIFGWLGFDILDGWWPERQMTSAEYVFYQAQQNHIKHVECITRAVKGKHVGREELRKAVLSFAGSDQCTEVTCAELKAMFYFAECQQDGHVIAMSIGEFQWNTSWPQSKKSAQLISDAQGILSCEAKLLNENEPKEIATEPRAQWVPQRLNLGTRGVRQKMAGGATFRNPHNLPVKDCVVCGRPFTWRKKWERCWDEVTTCSNRCRTERRHRAKSKDGAVLAGVSAAAAASAGKKVSKSEEANEDAEDSKEPLEGLESEEGVPAVWKRNPSFTLSVEAYAQVAGEEPMDFPVNPLALAKEGSMESLIEATHGLLVLEHEETVSYPFPLGTPDEACDSAMIVAGSWLEKLKKGGRVDAKERFCESFVTKLEENGMKDGQVYKVAGSEAALLSLKKPEMFNAEL
ncbi:unnamed protein product [Cladocopium goreaui]|uniref:Ubiquinone/menaquinone biosynthesis C-methyltransferase UbiE n=1 Tax=Cladocopium goreaui TaxID=2562237 RepID=A0A9P1G056_9DINO|nr:unnamed protein product [Cladocopium goreaui]